MLVFLRDSTWVLSRPAGSGTTQEMKLRLWWLYCLCTNIPVIPSRKNWAGLAWNVCWSTKSLVDATSYIQESVETKKNIELNNTSGGIRLAFHEQGPLKEMEFYQCVTKCCCGYNHPPKFCLSLFWSLPTNLSQHFVLLRQVLKLHVLSLHKGSVSITVDPFPSQAVHTDSV